jgi:hypothetical protein
MSIAERVNKFLTDHQPAAFCDDCLAERLQLSRRQQAHRVTSALGTTSNFSRANGRCSLCGDEKLVIQRT